MSAIMAMAALEYLRGGHRLLALRGKRPHSRWHAEWSWENSIHGLPSNPDEMAVLDRVWDDPTVTGIAILVPEHVLVADIDTEDAARLFAELAGIPDDTAIARTTKGLHVWYLAPGASGSRWLGDRTLLFKGFGGYVAVWPSKHFTDDSMREQDGMYTWLNDISDGIDWLPPGIDAMFKAQDAVAALNPRGSGGEHDMVAFEVDGWKWWPTYRMDGLVRAIENAADGNQNNVIHWAACTARDGGVPLDVSMKTLRDAAVRGHHPLNRAVSTIRGAYKARRG